mmetsp:Transcript_66018/g.182827  ORF Transcript_66018/g.182827 Transcript_66018/m.182827 type:complete len:214 (+) Transcript_66018:504-1145(+)
MHEAKARQGNHGGCGRKYEVPAHRTEVEEAPEDPEVRARGVLEEPAARPRCIHGSTDKQQGQVEERDDAHEVEGRKERPMDEPQGHVQQHHQSRGCQPQWTYVRVAIPHEGRPLPGPRDASGDLEARLGDEHADAADATDDEVAREVAHSPAKPLPAEQHEANAHDRSGHCECHHCRRQCILPGPLRVNDALCQGVHEGNVLHHHHSHCTREV